MGGIAGETALKRTPLNTVERELGGKMVDFGGWELPVQFAGIMEEHAAVRERVGLFDVSHMGELRVTGPQALEFLQKTTSNDVSKMADGRCQYNAVLYANAGFVDDILIYRRSAGDYLLVVNAANTDKDFAWLSDQAAGFDIAVTNESAQWAQLALQGPRAEATLAPLTDVDLRSMKYYWFAEGKVGGHEAIVSRTGYTGEDGFEIYLAPEAADAVFRLLLEAGRDHGIEPCGLGARDTLRLEAKMLLYGNDMDEATTPLEAGIGWAVKLDKGDFNGRDVLERQSKEGVSKKLVGFEVIDRGIARHGYPVVDGTGQIGVVTSGTHSPTLKKAIGLAYLPPDRTAEGSEFLVLIRGRETRARVIPTPFYKRAR